MGLHCTSCDDMQRKCNEYLNAIYESVEYDWVYTNVAECSWVIALLHPRSGVT